MIDFEAKRLTKALRGFDSSLFVKRDEAGRLAIYAERLLRPDDPEFVLYLTEDWSAKTGPREYGVLRIIEKLQSMRKTPLDALDECLQHNARVQESRERARVSETEAFLKDYRRTFAKTFSDINTSTIRKVDRRRELEKRYGHQ